MAEEITEKKTQAANHGQETVAIHPDQQPAEKQDAQPSDVPSHQVHGAIRAWHLRLVHCQLNSFLIEVNGTRHDQERNKPESGPPGINVDRSEDNED